MCSQAGISKPQIEWLTHIQHTTGNEIIYKGGKHNGTVKKQLCPSHIKLIKNGKFIPGLFNDCNIKNATRGKGSRKGRK